jgi:hypothetical protein
MKGVAVAASMLQLCCACAERYSSMDFMYLEHWLCMLVVNQQLQTFQHCNPHSWQSSIKCQLTCSSKWHTLVCNGTPLFANCVQLLADCCINASYRIAWEHTCLLQSL